MLRQTNSHHMHLSTIYASLIIHVQPINEIHNFQALVSMCISQYE